jgi:hypothetical protein
VHHNNGCEFLNLSETILRAGVKVGTEAAKEDPNQDKCKTLLINDTIGLHDKQHVVMLKSCGLGVHLAGISAVKDARKEVNSLVHELLYVKPCPGGSG